MTYKFPGIVPPPSKIQQTGALSSSGAVSARLSAAGNASSAALNVGRTSGEGQAAATTAARSLLQGKSLGETATDIGSTIASRRLDQTFEQKQKQFDKTLGNVSKKIGINLGRTSIDKLLLDPKEALKDLIPGSRLFDRTHKKSEVGGWMALLRSRADPLMEMNWYPQFPFGLLPEYVEEIQFTEPTIATSQPVFMNGRYIPFPMNHTVNTISVSFYEDRLMTVSRWLEFWKRTVSPDGMHFNYPVAYKKPIRMYAMDVAGKTVGQFCAHGCFPSSSPTRTMGSDGSSRVRLQVDFSCEWIDFQPLAGAGNWIVPNSVDSGATGDASQRIVTVGVRKQAETLVGRLGSKLSGNYSAAARILGF